MCRYSSENNFIDHQNNYVERLSVDDNAAKSFNILVTSSYINILMIRIKLFSHLYLAKFLDSSAKALLTYIYDTCNKK